MATRGVNGAASGTLNERFIKCEGCGVNVPKEDMLELSKCTVCGRPYEVVVTDNGRGIEVETVAFDGIEMVEEKLKRKRWAVLTSKRGRTYYHNTETGEDRWDKPADLDADAIEDAFVPFKNDAVKKAVLREQMKIEATKMGMPIEMVAASQQQLQQEAAADDIFVKLRNKNSLALTSSAKHEVTVPPQIQEVEEVDKGPAQQQAQNGGSCIVM
ncbi:uncharacterized protein PITG_13225 [Phytophthora infestans T30-4]|uniref:WW domain-containing protein n=2 Tax=Phytophthora infestans TaxID=4787 RepID=D0NLG9_PHYIT|nr:uncharacterized protein PITG_13225 [Phytophthora infestans T30-4]EEY60516.1 conserved hypothetical protein [Phytophthora infestans T30-4]KAF4035944.1 putative WW domain-containing protein [Phytophthora infestans]KAF4129275.1 WW domain-containing protein [Phytophthora infestans]KAI9987323.1 hypothetical protein PInf_023326 [Phytophthora infestans]|eukprot:XP_002899889.1 conserved hypothetical protein [Phytophthora infestans T30-4]